MKQSKKIFKKIKSRGCYAKKPSFTSLANEYYGDIYSRSSCRRRFIEDLEKNFGHHLTLEKLLRRRGRKPKRGMTPSMLKVLHDRLGEP